MKYSLFFFLFLHLSVSSQDWALFHADQKSFYQKTDGNIVFMQPGYVIVSGVKETYIFDKLPPVENAGICEANIDTAFMSGIVQCNASAAFPYLDSVVYRDDTAYIFGAGISYGMFFLNNAKINDSWHILSETADDILLKCSDIDTQNIFGITDSVRIFSFYKPSGSTILSARKIVLSKNFGLLDFIDFNYLTIHTETGTPVYYNLKGIEQGPSVYGFSLPAFEDYFPYKAGDKLFWQYHLYSPIPDAYINYIYYRTDSIIEKNIYADSIVFIYNARRKETSGEISYLYDQKNVFTRSAFEPLLFSASEWLSVSHNMYGSFISDDWKDIWCTEQINLSVSDSVISRSFYTGTDFLIPADCSVGQTTDISSGFSINTRAGISSHGRGTMSADETWTLIGSVISGVGNGITPIDDLLKSNNNLIIYPNPAQSFIKINLPVKKYDHKIYAFNNQLISYGLLENNTVDIERLSSGIYFIELQNENEICRGKFVKL